jgi:hypothetical protein
MPFDRSNVVKPSGFCSKYQTFHLLDFYFKNPNIAKFCLVGRMKPNVVSYTQGRIAGDFLASKTAATTLDG